MLPINYVCWQERQMSQDGSNADKKSADHAIPVAVIGAVGAIVAALIAGDGRAPAGPAGRGSRRTGGPAGRGGGLRAAGQRRGGRRGCREGPGLRG